MEFLDEYVTIWVRMIELDIFIYILYFALDGISQQIWDNKSKNDWTR